MHSIPKILTLTGFIFILLSGSFVELTAQQPTTEPTLDALFDMAFNAYADDEYERSIELYTQYIIRDESSATVYNNRGLAHHQLGQYEAALADFDRAFELNPNNLSNTYTNRGFTYYLIEDYHAALDDFRRAVMLDPDNRRARYNIARANYALENYDAALQTYNILINDDPEYHFAINNRGVIYYERGDTLGALADFTRVMTISPDYIIAYRNRALVLRDLARYDDAAADLATAISITPDDPRNYLQRADLAYVREDYGAAMVDYATVLSLNPDEATSDSAYFMRGASAIHLRSATAGNADFQEWLKHLSGEDQIAITLPDTRSGTYDISDTILNLDFVAEENDPLAIKIENAPGSNIIPVAVLVMNDVVLGGFTDIDRDGSSILINFVLPADGTYHLLIVPSIAGENAGTIQVDVEKTPLPGRGG